jgi:hypothetical protein
MQTLTQHEDGVGGVDLGVIGAWQYALVVWSFSGQPSEVMRRAASEVGTYGGWRYHCQATSPARYPDIDAYAELAARIVEATQPALPGAEDVRAQEVPHPSFTLPAQSFTLTAPRETEHAQPSLLEVAS